jgi:hypothetical protein
VQTIIQGTFEELPYNRDHYGGGHQQDGEFYDEE